MCIRDSVGTDQQFSNVAGAFHYDYDNDGGVGVGDNGDEDDDDDDNDDDEIEEIERGTTVQPLATALNINPASINLKLLKTSSSIICTSIFLL